MGETPSGWSDYRRDRRRGLGGLILFGLVLWLWARRYGRAHTALMLALLAVYMIANLAFHVWAYQTRQRLDQES